MSENVSTFLTLLHNCFLSQSTCKWLIAFEQQHTLLAVFLFQYYKIKVRLNFFFLSILLRNIYMYFVAYASPPLLSIIDLNVAQVHNLTFLLDFCIEEKNTNYITPKHKRLLFLVMFIFVKSFFLFNPHPTLIVPCFLISVLLYQSFPLLILILHVSNAKGNIIS